MDQGYAVLLYEGTNGHEIRHAEDVDLLRYCQQVVRGNIEIVYPKCMERPYLMVVNEEGWLRNMKINPVASYLYGTQDHGELIVGPALILKQIMTDDGPDVGFLTQEEALHLVVRLGKAHQWCAMYDFIFDIAASWAMDDADPPVNDDDN